MCIFRPATMNFLARWPGRIAYEIYATWKSLFMLTSMSSKTSLFHCSSRSLKNNQSEVEYTSVAEIWHAERTEQMSISWKTYNVERVGKRQSFFFAEFCPFEQTLIGHLLIFHNDERESKKLYSKKKVQTFFWSLSSISTQFKLLFSRIITEARTVRCTMYNLM